MAANSLRRLDEIRYFLLDSKTVLTKQTVDTAFRKKCFSAEKIKEELSFEFEPMENVIKEVTEKFNG